MKKMNMQVIERLWEKRTCNLSLMELLSTFIVAIMIRRTTTTHSLYSSGHVQSLRHVSGQAEFDKHSYQHLLKERERENASAPFGGYHQRKGCDGT